MNHLAIYNTKAYGDDYIKLMLEGIKTVDSKFMFRRTVPYKCISIGDVIYLKESSGPIRGRIRVDAVVDQALQDPQEVMEFLAPHCLQLGIKDEAHLMRVWEANVAKRYVTQWRMSCPEPIAYPVYIIKHDMRIWISDYNVPEEVMVAF